MITNMLRHGRSSRHRNIQLRRSLLVLFLACLGLVDTSMAGSPNRNQGGATTTTNHHRRYLQGSPLPLEPGPVMNLEDTPSGQANNSSSEAPTTGFIAEDSSSLAPSGAPSSLDDVGASNSPSVEATTSSPTGGIDGSIRPDYSSESWDLAEKSSLVSKCSSNSQSNTWNIHVVPIWKAAPNDRLWVDGDDYFYHVSQPTLGSVLDALEQNTNRTFVSTDMQDLSRWYLNDEGKSQKIKDLLATPSQCPTWNLAFSAGGWAPPSRQAPPVALPYTQWIHSHSLAASFVVGKLSDNNDKIPPTRMAWDLDGVGGRSEWEAFFYATAGKSGLVVDSLDPQYPTKTGIWEPSSAPSSLYWEHIANKVLPGFWNDETVSGIPSTAEMSLSELFDRLDDLLIPNLIKMGMQNADNLAHFLLPMASNVGYKDAFQRFDELDALVAGITLLQDKYPERMEYLLQHVDMYTSVNIFYSTPEYYLEMRAQEDVSSLNVEEDDFCPVRVLSEATYTTAGILSNPLVARWMRVGFNLLEAARHIQAWSEWVSDDNGHADADWSHSGWELELALAANPTFVDDWMNTMQQAFDNTADFVTRRLRTLLRKINKGLILLSMHDSDKDDAFSFCPTRFTNETSLLSECSVSQKYDFGDNPDQPLMIVVYNPLAHGTSGTVVSIPLKLSAGSTGSNRLFEVMRVADTSGDSRQVVAEYPSVHDPETKLVSFATDNLPALGYVAFELKLLPDAMDNTTTALSDSGITLSDEQNGKRVVKNGLLTVEFDATSGKLLKVSSTNLELPVHQTWGYYAEAAHGTTEDFTVFRPEASSRNPDPLGIFEPTSSDFSFESPGVLEIRTIFDVDWLVQVTRIFADTPIVEVEYTVGPIPLEGATEKGSNIVTRYGSSHLAHSSTRCLVDSHGRDFVDRKFNKRPNFDLNVTGEISDNYYPVTSAISVESKDKSAAFAVLTDRSQAGGCIQDGSVELLVHRRLKNEDETIIRGTHRIAVDGTLIPGPQSPTSSPLKGGAATARQHLDDFLLEPLVFVGVPDMHYTGNWQGGSEASILTTGTLSTTISLPRNAMLLTYSKRHNDVYLVRLAHQYGSGEHDLLSQPAEVDLTGLFGDYRIEHIQEMVLTADEKLEDWVDARVDWLSNISPSDGLDAMETSIELQPLEIRTMLVKLQLDPNAPVPTPHSSPHSSPHATPHASPTHPSPSSAPHHSSHTRAPDSSTSSSSSSESSPNLTPLYALLGVVVVGGGIFLWRRKRRYRQFDVAAGHDLDFELELAGYRPGLT